MDHPIAKALGLLLPARVAHDAGDHRSAWAMIDRAISLLQEHLSYFHCARCNQDFTAEFNAQELLRIAEEHMASCSAATPRN